MMKIKKAAFFVLSLLLIINSTISCFADEDVDDSASGDVSALDAGKAVEVESNDITDWPQGPIIGADSAILMDADSGVILYEKNIDAKEYPASITKIMTCLIAAESCSMDEMVTFSHDAVFGIDKGSSNVGMDVGQSITMEDAIYCIMLSSANEVAAAVAEHISGSCDEFAKLMNKRAKELGCTNTHFANANGLPNEDHWTSAHDMALIAQAFNKNDSLRHIAGTNAYEIKATATQPDTFTMYNHHKMYPGKKYAYDYVTWGKTGYTNVARETLVTCAEKNGMDLICVVMRDEPPYQYTDTRDLLEYGFNNFSKLYIADNEDLYDIGNSDFFQTDMDIFGNSETFLSLNPSGYVLLPNTADFSDTVSSIAYNSGDSDSIATISYTFNKKFVGSTTVDVADNETKTFEFGQAVSENTAVSENAASDNNVIFVNLKKILIAAGILAAVLLLFIIIRAIIKNYNFSGRRRRNIRKKNRRYHSEFDDFDF